MSERRLIRIGSEDIEVWSSNDDEQSSLLAREVLPASFTDDGTALSPVSASSEPLQVGVPVGISNVN